MQEEIKICDMTYQFVLEDGKIQNVCKGIKISKFSSGT
jgi:hypothetical protein